MNMSELAARQLLNAALVVSAAAPFGLEAVQASLMAALDESSLLRYANDGSTTRTDVPVKYREIAATSLAYPHDAVAGSAWTTADSVGMYQQRPMFDYGTIAELMDPAESTRIFIRGSHGGTGTTRAFLNAPKNLSLPQKVQWTQGSEYPTGENYAPFESVANQLIAHFSPQTQADWLDMATQAEVKDAFAQALGPALADLRGYIVDGNVLNAIAATVLAHDTGSGRSLAGELAMTNAALQRVEAKLNALLSK